RALYVVEFFDEMVGATGFEPATPCAQGRLGGSRKHSSFFRPKRLRISRTVMKSVENERFWMQVTATKMTTVAINRRARRSSSSANRVTVVVNLDVFRPHQDNVTVAPRGHRVAEGLMQSSRITGG